MMRLFFGWLFSYIVGSIPTAYLAGKFYKGIDIRQHGSGNVGTTNAFRTLGKGPGIAVLFIDIFKGIFVVTFIGDLFGLSRILFRVLAGLAVVAGHNWTIFLRFKGGKGIATSLGVLIGLTWEYPALFPVVLSCVFIWIVIFLLTGFVSLSSIIASLLLPMVMLVTHQPIEFIILGAVISIFVVFRHRSNLKRLFEGTEAKVSLPLKLKKR